MTPIRTEILGDDGRDGHVGGFAGAEPEVIGDEERTRLLNIFRNGVVAGVVLNPEVIYADRPNEIFRMKQLGVGVRDRTQESTGSIVDLVALQLIGVHLQLGKTSPDAL